MATSKEDIREWVMAGFNYGATHVIIMCDTYDWEDYPKYVGPNEDVMTTVSNPGSMQKVMEVYALHLDIEKQLNEFRAYHTESKP
jgi:hypothetical protein